MISGVMLSLRSTWSKIIEQQHQPNVFLFELLYDQPNLLPR